MDQPLLQQDRQDKEYLQSPNFLWTNITPLIDMINRQVQQIENDQLINFLQKGIDPVEIIQYINKVIEQKKQPSFDRTLSEVTPTWYIFRHMFLWMFVVGGLLNALQKVILTLCVVLLDQVTDKLKNYEQNKDLNEILLLLLGMMIAFFFETYITSKYNAQVNFFMAKLKIVSQYLIYQKLLKTMQLQEAKKEQSEQDDEENKDKEQQSSVYVDQSQISQEPYDCRYRSNNVDLVGFL